MIEGYKDIRIDEANVTISFQEPGSEKKTDLKIRDFVSSVELNGTTSNRLLNEMSFQQLKEVQDIAERIHVSVPSGIITRLNDESMKAAREYLANPETLRAFQEVFFHETDKQIIDRLSELIKEGDVLPKNDPLLIAEIKLNSLRHDVAHHGPRGVMFAISVFLESPQLSKALKSERREISLELLGRLQSEVCAADVKLRKDFAAFFETEKIVMQLKVEVLSNYVDDLPEGQAGGLLHILADWKLPIDQLKAVAPPEEGLQAFYSLLVDLKERRLNKVEYSFLGSAKLSYTEYRQMEAEIRTESAHKLEEQASCFVVREKEFITIYRYSPDQTQYGIEMGVAVKMGEWLVREKGIRGKELIQFLAGRRQRIAMIQRPGDAYQFGSKRLEHAFTPSIGPYYGQIPKELRKTRKFIKWDDAGDYKKCFEPLLKRTTSQMENIHFFEIKGTLPDDENIILNVLGTDFEVNPEENLQRIKALSHILHVELKPAELDRILEHVANLFDEAIRPDTPFEAAKEKLIRAFWWICQAKPWRRGDPSIAELFMKTGFALKGIPLSPWKEATIPWVEVILKSEKDFVDSFEELLGSSAT